MGDVPTHADILGAVDMLRLTLQRVETKVDTLTLSVGTEAEDERGNPFGTGIRGRLMRMEAKVSKRFRLYDDWRAYATGALAASVLLATALWWLVQDKVGHVLK